MAMGEMPLLDVSELLGGTQVVAMVGLARPLIRESIRPLVAFDTDVGRDPLDVHVPVFECVVVKFSYSAHERAVCFGMVVFGDGNGCVRAVSE